MKFRELFTGADGIFNVFEQSFPTEFADLFGELTPQALNSLALGLYGNKSLFDYITAESYAEYVKTCIALNLFNWKRLNDAITAEYSVTTSYKSEHTKTGTEGVTVDETNENLNAKKPFNNQDFDNGERQQNTRQRGEDRTYNLTDTTTRSVGGATVGDNIQKEIQIRRFNLQRQIMSDLVSELTLSVYD